MEERTRESFSLLNEASAAQNGYRNSPLGGNRQAVAKKLVIKNLKIAPRLPPDFQVGTLFPS
jgi:hypothetical protein